MKNVTFKIVGAGSYSQSKVISTPKKDKETNDAHEERCWRDRMHRNNEGDVYIPPMAIRNCLASTAKFLGMQIPSKGKATYRKHFDAGLICVEPIQLLINGGTIHFEDADMEKLFVPSDGITGGGKRVFKHFPLFTNWSGFVSLQIVDDTITESVFEEHLQQAGLFRGIGRFRPERNGFYGRFGYDDLKFTEM